MVTHTSIIATHQARIRCLLYSYGAGIMDKTQLQNAQPQIKRDDTLTTPLLSSTGGGPSVPGQVASFKNGAVLRLVIDNIKISVSLVVSGEIGGDEAKAGYTYFTTGERTPGVVYGETTFVTKTIPNKIYHNLGEDIYEFYIVRHGQAVHNTLKGLSKLNSPKDTNLTSLGKQQAFNTGISLSNLIRNSANKYGTPVYMFSSDLRRTRQTILQLMSAFPDTTLGTIPEDTPNTLREINVLPCAHELTYKINQGSCDGPAQPMVTPNENIATCSGPGDCSVEKGVVKTNNGRLAERTYTNNWDEYNRFYGDATRSTRKKLTNCLTSMCKNGANSEPVRKKCRYTDMISNAIEIIHTKYSNSDDGRESTTSNASSDMTFYTPRSSISSYPSRDAMYERPTDIERLGGTARNRTRKGKRGTRMRKRKTQKRKRKTQRRKRKARK